MGWTVSFFLGHDFPKDHLDAVPGNDLMENCIYHVDRRMAR